MDQKSIQQGLQLKIGNSLFKRNFVYYSIKEIKVMEKQELVVEVLKKAIKDSDKMFKTKEQSDAYIIGMLQGTIKAIIDHLED